jgi:membrane associated rhomboid family serine protease
VITLFDKYLRATITNKIIYINVTVFVIQCLTSLVCWSMKREDLVQTIFSFIELPLQLHSFLPKFYTLFTFQFMHDVGNVFHLIMNMLTLFFIAPLFSTFQSEKRILPLYILGGVFGGFLTVILYNTLPVLQDRVIQDYMLGASASIMAILFAATTFSPYYEVYLFGVFKVKLLYLALFILLMDLVNVPLSNHGGHISHIGGALMGFLYVKALQNGTNLGAWLEIILDKISNLARNRHKPIKLKVVHRSDDYEQVEDVKSNQEIVDEILDKISRSGYDSLSAKDKRTLFEQSKK